MLARNAVSPPTPRQRRALGHFLCVRARRVTGCPLSLPQSAASPRVNHGRVSERARGCLFARRMKKKRKKAICKADSSHKCSTLTVHSPVEAALLPTATGDLTTRAVHVTSPRAGQENKTRGVVDGGVVYAGRLQPPRREPTWGAARERAPVHRRWAMSHAHQSAGFT